MHNKLNFLLGISLTLILLFKFVLKDVPSYFYFDDEIKEVLVNISLSYIAAYIFYFLQIWIPEEKRKEQLRKVLFLPLNSILSEIKKVFNAIDSEISFNEKGELSPEHLKELKNFNMKNSTNYIKLFLDKGNISHYNYLEMIANAQISIKKFISQSQKLEPDNLKLNIILDRIENCDLFVMNDKLYSISKVANHIEGNVYIDWLIDVYELYWILSEYMRDNEIKLRE